MLFNYFVSSFAPPPRLSRLGWEENPLFRLEGLGGKTQTADVIDHCTHHPSLYDNTSAICFLYDRGKFILK